ncbi:MAG: c-type cytochrome, partial [Sediminibacterium sp.]|nr:c-type cytochrome [Sediminibacterium sp.]
MKKWMVLCLLLVSGMGIVVSSQTNRSGLKASMTRGKQVYDRYCLTCHQADGGGVPRMNPPIANTEYVLGNKQRLIGIVLNGLNVPLEIN